MCWSLSPEDGHCNEDFSTYEDLNKYEDLKKAGIHNQNTIKFTLAAHAWRYMLGGMHLTASMVHMIETPAFQGFQLNELLGTDSLMTRNTSQKVKPHAFAFWAAFLYCSPFGDYISPGKAVVCVSARQSCSFCLSLLTVQLGLRMLPQKVRPIAEAREKVPRGTWPLSWRNLAISRFSLSTPVHSTAMYSAAVLSSRTSSHVASQAAYTAS